MEKSFIHQHIINEHGGNTEVKFKMTIIKSYQNDPLGRQLREAGKIRKMDPDKSMNSREEYHQPGDVRVNYVKNVREYKNKNDDKNDNKHDDTNDDKNDNTNDNNDGGSKLDENMWYNNIPNMFKKVKHDDKYKCSKVDQACSDTPVLQGVKRYRQQFV